MKQNSNDRPLVDREEEQNLPSNSPPVPLPRDTSDCELDISSDNSPVLIARKKLEPEDNSHEKPFILETQPSEIEQESDAQRSIKGMNRYIDKQYENYIAGKEKITPRLMTIISSKVTDKHAGLKPLPSELLYSAYRGEKLLDATVDSCDAEDPKYPPLLIKTLDVVMWIEKRDGVIFGKDKDIDPRKKKPVCILFLADEGEASNLRSNAQTLKENRIPFILVGSIEQEGMASAKELGAVLFIEGDHQYDDSDNLGRLVRQVAMVASLNEKEQELYQRTYWAELEYQNFIKLENDAAKNLLSKLNNYIQDYDNNPAEKFRDVVVSSTLFQRIVPPAKNTEHKTEDNKKKAAQKLIDKLKFDIQHSAYLGDLQDESNFTLAEIDALLEGTLGRIVRENASVYDRLAVIRDKLKYEQNYPNAAERNYQSFLRKTGSRTKSDLLYDLEKCINSCKGNSTQQNRNLLVSSFLFRPVTTPVADQTEEDINKSAAEKLVRMLKLDWENAAQLEAPRKFLGAEKQQFTIQEMEALCNSNTRLGEVVARHEELHELFVDMRHKKSNQLQQTQSAQPPKDSGLFGSFSRK